MSWIWRCFPALVLLVYSRAGEDEDIRAGCSTAVNDLVYIMDGSWSVGDEDFEIAKRWLVNVTSGFDVSSHYSQVGVVQYSDTPRLEIPLGLHKTTQDLIKAIEEISYLGGNTQTGRAIKFSVDHVFTSSQRSDVKNRIAVVVTDGKSQDDVMDASIEAREQGITVFAVGVGSEITTSELVTIANTPQGDYVLYAEDYTNIERIRDAMAQKLCEESVCPTRIPVASRDEKGFELMLGMKIHQKAQKIQGSLLSEAAYLLDKSTDITENTREIFPEGLPPSYVFVSTLRLKGPSIREKLDLWRILSKDGQIQAAVTLNGPDKSLIFTTTNTVDEEQTATFDAQGIEALFDGSWHQLKVLVKPRHVTCFLDDQQIQDKPLETSEPIFINGKTQISKRFSSDVTLPTELQKLRLYCDPHQSERETACEIYSVDDERCPLDREPSANEDEDECDCSEGPSGPRGERGEPGRAGPPGPDGKPVQEESQETQVHLEKRVTPVYQDREEIQDSRGRKVSEENKGCQGNRARLDQWEQRDPSSAQLERQDKRESRGREENEDLTESPVQWVNQDSLGAEDPPALLDVNLPSRPDATLTLEPCHSEPGHSEPCHSEPGHSEPGSLRARVEPGHSEPGHSEPGSLRVGSLRVGSLRARVTPSRVTPSQGHSEPGSLRARVTLSRVTPSRVTPSQGHSEPGHSEPGHSEPGSSRVTPSQGHSEPGSL
ncbi:unnamed protein product [Leuciscus chuanchicus]